MIRWVWRSLTVKWVFTLLFTGLFGVALVWFFANRATNTGFDQLKLAQAQAAFESAVTSYYQQHGSWAGVRDAVQQQFEQNQQSQQGQQPDQSQPPPPGDGPRGQPPDPQFVLVDDNNQVIISAPPFRPGDQVSGDPLSHSSPITVDGKQVGAVLFAQGTPRLNPLEQRFLAQTNESILLGAAGAALIALLLGTLLARHFMRPLHDLTLALGAMRAGNLEQEIPVRSQDELGQLIQTFNHMSKDLVRANYLRRQMTADIAHDLRTPLTVIAGYLEGMQDGTLKPTAQRFETMASEVQRLQRLVEDLRTLSLADAGELKLNLQPVVIEPLLTHVASSFQPLFAEKGLHLDVKVELGLAEVNMDRERILQVLGNLVSNARRYTQSGGSVTLRAVMAKDTLDISVQDTGEGIPPDKLPYVFERLYRVDPSRGANEDESGLGLAIVKSLVEAHGGTITVESTVGKGTTFALHFPRTLLVNAPVREAVAV